jgi:hypothetical protein
MYGIASVTLAIQARSPAESRSIFAENTRMHDETGIGGMGRNAEKTRKKLFLTKQNLEAVD